MFHGHHRRGSIMDPMEVRARFCWKSSSKGDPIKMSMFQLIYVSICCLIQPDQAIHFYEAIKASSNHHFKELYFPYDLFGIMIPICPWKSNMAMETPSFSSRIPRPAMFENGRVAPTNNKIVFGVTYIYIYTPIYTHHILIISP